MSKVSSWSSCFGLVVILCLVAIGSVWAQTGEPILRLEVGTHSASVFTMAMDSSNRILVTGSEDKTVRVWDISGNARLLRIIRPPVGEMEQGQIFAVALSPDGHTIACGGRTGLPKQKDGCVYLFNRDTGALTLRLGGLPGYVQDLEFTGDGRFLAVVYSERGGNPSWTGLSLFRMPDYALVAEDRDYGNYIHQVRSNPAGTKLATSCFDGFVRLYDLSAIKTKGAVTLARISPVAKISPQGGRFPWGLAFSPDGSRLAVGFSMNPRVDVLEVKGNTLTPAFSPETTGVAENKEIDFRVLSWSADGKSLYAGGGYRQKKVRMVRKWTDGGKGRYRDLPIGVDLPIHCLLPLKTGGVVYSSRDGSFGRINAQDQAAILSPKAIPIYAANEKGLLLSKDGLAVEFGYERGGGAPALFSITDRQLMDSSSRLWSDRTTRLAFQPPITEGLDVTYWETKLAPKLKGRPLDIRQEVSKCLAIKPDRKGFLLGTTNSLTLFDSDGKELWRKRMPGVVWSVNTNGTIAVTAIGDGTIRWYRLSDGDEILALFPHPDRKRWILWTPSGYYDASPGGEDFIGWHVNNGNDQAADFFPVSRFRTTYFRPDVIDRMVASQSEDDAIRLANDESGRKPTMVPVSEILPPVVTIVSPPDGAEVKTTSVNVKYMVRGQSLAGLKLLVDGRPVAEEGGDKPVQRSGQVTLTIPQRDCEVSVIALNSTTASEPATIRLRWKGAAPAKPFEIRPKLYVLAIGVGKYKDEELRLDLPAKDAEDFSAAWAGQKGKLYTDVQIRTLTDEKATKGDILDGLEWLQRQVTQKDVAVLFFAGHGVNDSSGEFYFLPMDADLDSLKRTGLSQFDVTSTVSNLAGKVMVFMDACHSGNLMVKTKRRGLSAMSAVINELASAENGAVVFSSATGRQYAMESKDWGNGAFTLSVVEGINGKADYGATGRITINMLDLYVSERVKELTGGQQTPSTVKPPNFPDFPVAILH